VPSRFGWVDFAEEDRERMLRVVDLFREQGTQDELGIGTIRDAFADCLFPGTSTIQTRARYLLFVPWMYQEFERRRVTSAEVAGKARQAETKLIDALLKAGETDGVIGQEAREHLKRRPSSVYWAGLRSWGILLFRGSQDQYHRYLDRFYRGAANLIVTDDKEPVGGGARANWHPGLPKAPDGLLDITTMTLTREEARYLQDNGARHHRHSLLAELLLSEKHYQCDFFWEHPQLQSLPDVLQSTIRHARNFSETIHGSALIYNLMMSRKRGKEEWVEKFEERVSEWTSVVQKRWEGLVGWHRDLNAFWSHPALVLATIPEATQRFVGQWLRILFNEGLTAIVSSQSAQALIVEREERLKRTRARLTHKQALDRWNGASGDKQLDFRWRNASSLLEDIHSGLGNGEGNA
jgi:Family of unknown function (DUF6361)